MQPRPRKTEALALCGYCSTIIAVGEKAYITAKRTEHVDCRHRRLNANRRARWNTKNPMVNGHHR